MMLFNQTPQEIWDTYGATKNSLIIDITLSNNWCKFIIKSGDVFLQTEGYYSSYSGYDFTNSIWKKVVPVKKTITLFETL